MDKELQKNILVALRKNNGTGYTQAIRAQLLAMEKKGHSDVANYTQKINHQLHLLRLDGKVYVEDTPTGSFYKLTPSGYRDIESNLFKVAYFLKLHWVAIVALVVSIIALFKN